MKFLAYFLIVLGSIQLAIIGYDVFRGVTSSPSDESPTVLPDIIHKQNDPENFHNAIVCHSYYALAPLFLGILMLVVDKRMDKSDPESPDFAGNKALGDWGKALDEEDARRKITKK